LTPISDVLRNTVPIDPVLAARTLGMARSMIGASALVAPSMLAAPWVGWTNSRPVAVRLFGRTLGGRDLALGLGLIIAADKGEPFRGWVQAGALADAADAAATLLAFPELPRKSRWLILALTAGAALAGAVVASGLDSGGDGRA
jgi:hypothetical protein